ncbi:MAG: tyrosine-protein phosphatase [Clostridia bacterium]|nr:tyrosine-protein phosphatase [Clostridia bacterium]
MGTDASGAKVDIPTDVQWAIAENGMGTINNGVFTSSGTEGAVTVQMIYKDKVVGERKINIATPDAISLSQPVVTIPYGKTANIPIKATVNNGLHTIGLGANDITFITDNSALGTFNGMSFSAVEESNAPANITSNVTAILNMGTNPSLNFQLNLGKASEVIFDFEAGQADVDEWNIIDNRKGTVWDYTMSLSLADKTNGEVHDGDYSMRMQLNGLSSNLSHSAEYGWIRLGINDVIELENARSVGFWLYIPEDCIHLWVLGNYMADTDDDGTYDSYANPGLPPAFPNQVYDTIDESGWHYLEFDVSQYKKIALKDERQFPCDGTNKDFFLQFIFARAKQNPILEHGTTIGPFTFYFDNFTVDYSEAVDDRENPVIEKIYINDEPMAKREVVIATGNTLSFTANVADAVVRVDANKVEHPLSNTSGINASSAKVFIDGVEMPASYSNGVMSANNVKVSDGYHRVRFEITDNAGNTSVMIRVFKVESGSAPASVQLVPADETLDRLLFGSVYWMNLKATNIEKIQSIDTVIDMNSVNHWQLDHMILADGFTAEYSVNEDSNTATISFARAGENDQTGEAIIAQIPVRILDYDSDIHVAGKTAAQYWETHEFWGHDLKLDVDKGLVTFVDGKTETFSNEEFSVDTEMYTPRYYMDADYLTTHGSTHIHTATPIADQAPTCTQPGYTGRTFCEVCNSVVEWGETISATGHSYEVVGDKLACHCGEEITGSGIKTVNGKNYYLLAGTLASGWRIDEAIAMADIDTSKYTDVEINPSLVTNTDGWYYFDETTYEGINGKRTFTISGVKIEYNFVNGLVDGVWKSDGTGMKYYYGPANVKYIKRSQLSNFCWVAIDGKIYAFNKDAHRYEGYSVLVNTTGEAILCEFDDGVLIGKYSPGENYTGIFKCNSQTTYLKNGVPSNAGLVKDGNDYYYIASGYEAVVGNYDVTRPNGLLLPGFYQFASDGKMISPPIYADGPNTDGFFYKDGIKLSAYQLVEFEGNYYFINDYNKYARNKSVYLSARFVEGTGFPVGYYEFDENGKMIIKNGPNADGYFYLNGVRQNAYQLINYEGDYYLIYDAYEYAKDRRIYLTADLVEGTDLLVGYYDFDAEGKMIIKNGPNADGYFYLNGVRQNAYQLINYEGDYYLIYDAHEYAKDRRIYLTANLVEGTDLLVGYYDFDAEGKMIIKNGPNADGYFYLNGTRVGSNTLIKYEGNYYFVGAGNKYVTGKWQYTGIPNSIFDGTDIRPWHHSFDNEGKMIGYYEGLPNGRDIGDIYNLKTTDGKDIKSGLLIRGCELDNANYYYPTDIIEIGINRLQNEFGVKFDMDLRNEAVSGLDVFDSNDVTHKFYDMAMYDQIFTTEGKAKIKEVFTDLANPDNYPIYLHCTHGIDRTGTICFILEAVLGVPYQMCIYEYTLSVGSYGQQIVNTYNVLNSTYSGSSLKSKAEAYLLDCGITAEQIESLRSIYLGD